MWGRWNKAMVYYKKNQAKQFIDFGDGHYFGKTLERIKNNIFDYPIISTN